MSKKEKIIICIDYFSRKVFGKLIRTKHSKKVLDFLKKVYEEFPYETLVADNGREFFNKKVKKWGNEMGINIKFTIPYYHQSNGRVERVNRTIRNALTKTPGNHKINLIKVIENYNNARHRGIGMSPNEALLEVNREKVIETENKYMKEFEKKNKCTRKVQEGDRVVVKNEIRSDKRDNRFEIIGTIRKNEYGDIYEILTDSGDLFKRHISQIKRIRGGEVESRDQTDQKEI